MILEAITRRRRFATASEKSEQFTMLKLRNLALYRDLKNYFLALSKPRAFSNEASIAMLLLIYSIMTCEQTLSDYRRGDFTPGITIRFGLVPSLQGFVLLHESLATDKERWNEHIGLRLKAQYNSVWHQLKKLSDSEGHDSQDTQQ